MMQERNPIIPQSRLKISYRSILEMDQVSIRASGNKGRSTFKAIPIEQALLEKAKHFLESYQFDLRIRQHLHEEKMANSIGKHKYYVLGNEQKYEPGYILVMKGQPIVFLQGRLQYGFVLRLRLHSSLYQNQAIFVGTLDTLTASLRLEDVLLYEGKLVKQDAFSKRYATLQYFFENAFVQDNRLSGLQVSLAPFHPLSSLKSLIESDQYYTIEFMPEQANQRRLVIPLLSKPPIVKQTQQQQTQQTQQPQTQQQTQQTQQTQPIKKEERTSATAFKIKGLPDTYELKDEKDQPLGKAAVQTSELSQLLRQSIQTEGKQVKIQWYEEFERYKILGLLE